MIGLQLLSFFEKLLLIFFHEKLTLSFVVFSFRVVFSFLSSKKAHKTHKTELFSFSYKLSFFFLLSTFQKLHELLVFQSLKQA